MKRSGIFLEVTTFNLAIALISNRSC